MKTFDGVSTRDLVEELRQRKGVEVTIAEPHKDTEIKVNGPATPTVRFNSDFAHLQVSSFPLVVGGYSVVG